MTEQMKETILSRIKKLLALTEARGATPEEAANAAAKAQALLFEHNLTMASVDAHDGNKNKTEGYDKTLYEMADGKDQSLGWRKSLLGIIARYNFCKLIVQIDGELRKTAMIGKKSNVEVAIFIYEHVQREIHRLAKAAQKRQAYNKSMFYTSFCLGAVSTISGRLREQAEKNERATSACTALVVQSDRQLQLAVKSFFPVLRSARGVMSRRPDGFEAGREAGKGISLNRGIGSTASRRLS